MPHFLDVHEVGREALALILDEAARRKAARVGWSRGRADADRPLDGVALACVFEKASTRTRVSFQMAMRQLGGHSIVLDAASTQLGRGEPVEDTARVLGRMADAIMLRTDEPAKLTAMAQAAGVPVINGLSDASHPCQAVADLLTVRERLGSLAGVRWVWLGDGNNVLHSLAEGVVLTGGSLTVCGPEGYDADPAVLERAGAVRIDRDPAAAMAGADVVVTDSWISMGQTDAKAKRTALAHYQVTSGLMRCAKPDALFLHCLPAHRGEEVAAEVIDGPRSAVWDEAENRLHAQKAILLWCLQRLG